jgi:hypothetical protein
MSSIVIFYPRTLNMQVNESSLYKERSNLSNRLTLVEESSHSSWYWCGLLAISRNFGNSSRKLCMLWLLRNCPNLRLDSISVFTLRLYPYMGDSVCNIINNQFFSKKSNCLVFATKYFVWGKALERSICCEIYRTGTLL